MLKRRPIRFFLIVFGLAAVLGAVLLHFLLDWGWLAAWLTSANVFALFLWGFDKFQSRRGGWRVPETALHLVALAGATPASLAAMQLFRHKTLKTHFVILYSILLVFQLALVFTLAGRA